MSVWKSLAIGFFVLADASMAWAQEEVSDAIEDTLRTGSFSTTITKRIEQGDPESHDEGLEDAEPIKIEGVVSGDWIYQRTGDFLLGDFQSPSRRRWFEGY